MDDDSSPMERDPAVDEFFDGLDERDWKEGLPNLRGERMDKRADPRLPSGGWARHDEGRIPHLRSLLFRPFACHGPRVACRHRCLRRVGFRLTPGRSRRSSPFSDSRNPWIIGAWLG